MSKFNFVPERQVGKQSNANYRVSIYPNHCLIFPAEVVRVYELDGKFARFYADLEKKVIGWSILEGETSLENLSDARKLSKNKQSGAIAVSLKKLLSSLDIKIDPSFKRLDVSSYSSPLNAHEIHYINLKIK